MSWKRLGSGQFACCPAEVEGRIRVVAGLSEIVALMKESQDEQFIVVTDVAGGSAVSTIIRRAKAIVSTIGGPKSHIVVVAQDHRVPCIVGASDIDLSSLVNGSRLRLEADGTIQIDTASGEGAASPEADDESSGQSDEALASAATELTSEQLRLLRLVVFSGAAEASEGIVGFSGDLEGGWAALKAAGLISGDEVMAATPAGEARLEAWYAEDRANLDEAERESLHEKFRPLDVRLKEIANQWQVAEGNDDWDARMIAIESLSDLHDRTLTFLDEYRGTLPRLEEYRERSIHAHEMILEGETEYFVGTQVDSYHTLWFHLHEDLLRLLQRSREAE